MSWLETPADAVLLLLPGRTERTSSVGAIATQTSFNTELLPCASYPPALGCGCRLCWFLI